MAHNYYLINGKNGNGNKVNLLSNGELASSFNDISILDLATMDINFKEKDKILKEYENKLFDFGLYYDLSYPHKDNESKSYVPIFNYGDSTLIKDYLNYLKYFAEQRKYKIDHNEKLVLDQNKTLDDFIYKYIGKVLRERKNRVSNDDSTIAVKLKDIINNKHLNKANMGVNNYINSNIYLLRSILSNYTQLRNFMVEMTRCELDYHIFNRSDLGRVNKWDNNIEANPIKSDEPEFKQLELFDLFPDEAPKIIPKTLKNKKGHN